MLFKSDDTTRWEQPVLDRDQIEQSNEPGAFGKVGSFHLQEELGRGGMGVVYKAWDESLRRIVAVKFIRQDRSLSMAARERFFREARAAASVSHPNIVVVHRIDEVRSIPFIVMEYVDGLSLEHMISREHRFSPLELMQLILQVAEGLQAAHENGIIHRDIKPSNIMVETGSGRSKISDFGLARIGEEVSSESEEGSLLGTPAYMSPEQVSGGVLDGRSDLFSLGCLIHAVVTGHSPFKGKSFADSVTRVLTTQPKPLIDSSPSVPAVLSNICSRLLEKNPADRYQTSKELVQEIRSVILDLQKGENVPMVDTIIVSSPSQIRRRRLQFGFIFLTLALGGGTLYWILTRPPSIQTSVLSGDPVGSNNLPQELTVSRDSDAEFQTITGALAASHPGDTIRVLDDRTYEVNLEIRGLHDLTIESENSAQLVPRDPLSPVLQIIESQKIKVRGFRINSFSDQHAIRLLDSSSIELENLEIVASPNELAVLQIDACNRALADAPLRVRNCVIESKRNGQCIWVQAIDHSIWNLELHGNSLLSQGVATNLVLVMKGGSATVEKNRLIGGHVGINLELRTSETDAGGPQLKILHNTFFHLRSWLGLMGSDPEKTPFELQHNLILDCPKVEASPEQQIGVAAHCRVVNNAWERTEDPMEGETDQLFQWATFHPEVRVLSRDPGTEGYLILPHDSPLRTADKTAAVGANP